MHGDAKRRTNVVPLGQVRDGYRAPPSMLGSELTREDLDTGISPLEIIGNEVDIDSFIEGPKHAIVIMRLRISIQYKGCRRICLARRVPVAHDP